MPERCWLAVEVASPTKESTPRTGRDHWRRDAKTVVFFAVDGVAAGIVAVADPLKETTPEAVKAFKAAGVNVVMLTGDSRETVEAVGRQFGIDEVISEVLPKHKAQHVNALQSKGHRVAMAGDGINDALALAQP